MPTQPAPDGASRVPDGGPPYSLPAELFDCIQVNLALLADRLHGPGTHLRAGAVLGFRPVTGADGLPTVEPDPERQLTAALGPLGLVAHGIHRVESAARITPAEGCYVIADAYHLPWLPYAGHRHLEHSFLVEPGPAGMCTVIDGYRNVTPWGPVEPQRVELSRPALEAALPGGALVALLGAHPAGTEPIAPDLDFGGPEAVSDYTAAYAECPDRVTALDRLTLETWLLARSRHLHAQYRASAGALARADETDRHIRDWYALNEQTYLAFRRVERGRPEPGGLLASLARLLDADREVFGDAPSAAPGSGPAAQAPPPQELRRAVAGAVAAVLGTEPGPLLGGLALSSVPSFSSFRMVEIIERLEEELAFEFDADDLVPERLHSIDVLCRTVQRSLHSGPRPVPAYEEQIR